MADSTGMDGYFTGADYPGQLVPQMTPAHIAAAAAWQGVRPPDLARPFRMLDIGCGRGCALVLAAASHPAGTFEGIDGMASHIAAGRDLARDVPNVRFRHATFEQALADARPDCDLIVMHGVLTWAGPTARRQAMDLAGLRLKPGGLLALSYNALPGRARHLAFQRLLCAFAPDFPGTPAQQFEAAFARVRDMADAGFGAVSRDLAKSLTEMAREAPTEYFLHEFMHGDWTPFWAADIAAALAGRGLEQVGSVDFLRLRPDLCLGFPQARFAAGLDPRHADLLIDMGLDTVFRSDLYARAPERGEPGQLRRDVWLGAEVGARPDLAVETPSGPADFDADAANRLVAALQDGPRRLGDLLGAPGHDEPALIGAVECLVIGQKLLALGPPAADAAPGPAAALNARLCQAALRGGTVPIAALAGLHGPFHMAGNRMGAFALDAAGLLDRARADPEFRRRYLAADASPDDPGVAETVAAGLDEVHRHCARLGAVTPR